MSHQLTFADSEFSSKRRQTRKEIFLCRMDNLLPWTQLLEVIDPFYPKAGNGRRPYALETMFRIHCMKQWKMRYMRLLRCVSLHNCHWIKRFLTAPPL